MRRGFTFIELITVLASLGILSSVVITLIKPIDIIRCSRDTQRIADLNALNSALGHYLSEVKNPDLDGPYFSHSGFDEVSSTIFLSIPKDRAATSTIVSFEGKIWRIIQPSSTIFSSRLNGEGWLPIDFLSLSKRHFNVLPLDPVNSFNKNYFYSYAFKRNTKSYELNSKFECQKFIEIAKNDGGDSELFEVGSDLNIIPPQIYGYLKKQISFPSIYFYPSSSSLTIPIGQVSSTKIYIANTGTAYLNISQLTQSNPNSFLKIDKNNFIIAPQNTTTLNLTCDGRTLKNSTTTRTTIFIWHNDPQKNNPYPLDFECNFISSPLIKIHPPGAILNSIVNGSNINATVTINNLGNYNLFLNLGNFFYKETSFSCPFYLTVNLQSEIIPPNSLTNLIFNLQPTSTKQNFYCRQIITTNDPNYPTITIPVYVKTTAPPKPPIIDNIYPYEETVIILWLKPEDDGGSEITEYRIYNENNSLITTTSGNILYYQHSNLINGQKYCYKITAINRVGESNFSQQRCAVPGGWPDQPQNFSATPGNKEVTLSWNPPTNNGGSMIDSYLLYYRKEGENNWRYLFDFPAYPTSNYKFTHQDLENGITYHYQIQAKNQFGISINSVFSSTTPRGYSLPPQKLETTVLSNGIRLTWQAPISNEGSSINFYRIYRSTSSLNNFVFLASTTATSYNDYSAIENIDYYYQVRAVNSIGESKRSNIERNCYGNNCFIESVRCDPPQNLTIQNFNNKIKLTWNYSGGEDFFNIYESTGDEYVLIATVDGTNEYIRTGLVNGKKYYYYVTQERGEFCTHESIPSNYVMGRPSSTPYAPLFLKSEEQYNGELLLFWQPPFSDEGDNINEYLIYRATNTPTSTYSLIATTTLTNYPDYTMTNIVSTPIYYYVRAKNNNGLGFKSNIVGHYNSQCFAKVYDITLFNNNLNDILKINNNKYLTIGWRYNDDTQKYNAFLTELDLLGRPISSKISNNNHQNSFNFILSSSSYYLLGGEIRINNHYDSLIVRLATNASTVIWAKNFGGQKDDKLTSGIIDGNEIILTGYTSSFTRGENDLFFSIFNERGLMKTFKIFGGNKNDIGQEVIKANDNGYLVLGYTNSLRKDYDILLVKFDQNGNIIWQKTYDAGGNELGISLTTTSNGYLISGYGNFDRNDYDVFVLSLDLQGNILWQKKYSAGGNDYISKIKRDYDGNYILVGRSNSYNNINYDGLIIKISSSTGEIIFSKTIGVLDNDSFNNFTISSPDYYFIVGNSKYYPQLGYSQIALNISSSSDQFFFYTLNQKNYLKIFLNNLNFFPSISNFKYYLSNFNLISPKILLSNYNFSLIEIFPSFENLANICGTAELSKKYLSELNLANDNFYLISRSGTNSIYLSFENFLNYFKLQEISPLGILLNIYRSSSSDNYLFNQTAHHTFYATDTSPLTGNNCYRYTMIFSNFSNEHCSATTSEKLRPTPPVNLQLQRDIGWSYLRLEWSRPQYNGGEPIQRYNIYRSTSTNEINNFVLIATTTVTSYNDTSTVLETNYCYYITAINSIGESDKSLIRCGARFSNLPTLNLEYSLTSDMGIRLTWNEIFNRDYYVIYRNNIKIATTNATSYVDYNYQKGYNNYKIEVIKNNTPSIFTLLSIYLPNKISPQNLNYNLGNNSVILTWHAPLLESGYIRHYSLYRKIKGSSYSDFPYATRSTSTLNFTDSNLIPGETYCYIVKANYINGESLPSNEVCFMAVILPQPSFSIKQTGAFGAWLVIDKIEDYSPKSGFGKIKEYRIYKATSSNFNLIATVTPDNLNYIDTYIIPSNGATYTISAVNEIGVGTSTAIKVFPNSQQSSFRYYKITTDNQIFEIGEAFTLTTLGERETGKRGRNYAIYIEVINPPKFISVVDITSSNWQNSDKVKEFKFICDNRIFNLAKHPGNRLYNLNLICSKMFIILNWDARLPESQIPKVNIEDITINQ
ncbi:MAG: fibronectin type III domain-containing protein [Patescibacteria group bacterium]|nr:fibronectin type III domain-containing protein [Patescibacteria group bacterium]